MEWLKSLLASWKVRVALVGGALVVATTYGTCTLEPAQEVSEASTSTTTPTTTVEVSTTTETTEPNTTDTTTTTNTSGE